MLAYTLICFIVCFFLLLNFVMAIIVEGYMGVRETLHDTKSWRNIHEDLYTLVQQVVLYSRLKWPERDFF